jgi:DNA ligase (NAD+)
VRRESIKHFVSKSGLDIRGVGARLVEQLLDQNLVRTPADLFRLDREELRGLDRMGEKSADNVLRALATAKQDASLPRLLSALGIRHVGEQTARTLAHAFGSLDALSAASQESLLAVPDIGPEAAAAIAGFFAEQGNRRLLEELKELGLWPVPAPRPSSPSAALSPQARMIPLPLPETTSKSEGEEKNAPEGAPMRGKTILFTGKLDGMTRSEAARMAENAGAAVLSAVSRKLDFLVVGEDPGSKRDKAEALGISLLTEEEFLRLLGR